MQTLHSTAAALVTLLVVAACSPASSGPSAPSGTSFPETSAPVLSPADEAGQQALDAYRGMWLSYAEAGTASDWQSPKLAEFATGTALTTMTRGLYGDHYKGVVSRGEPVLNPAVSSAEPAGVPTKVLVTDCGDSTNWTRHYADSGQPADDEPDGRRHIDAVVEKQVDDTWKVVEFGIQGVGTC